MPDRPTASTPSSSQPAVMPELSISLLYQALNGVPTAVYIKDRQHQWHFANIACCKLLGKSQQQLLGAAEAEIFPTPLAEKLCRQDAAHFLGHPSETQTLVLQDGRGVDRTVTRRTELNDDGTQLLCFLEAGITEPSEPASNLYPALSTPQFSSLLANIPAMVYQLQREPSGQIRFTFVSPGASELVGLSPQAIQSDPECVLAQIYPLDRPSFDAGLAAAATTLSTWRWEGRCYTSTGNLRWLQTTARAQAAPDNMVIWDGLLIDITSRKQAEAAAIEQAVMEQALADNEARFRTIAATLPGALFQLRVQGEHWSIDYISDRIGEIAGLSPAALMADAQQWLDRIYPFDRERLITSIETAATTVQPWQFEGRIITPSGVSRWWRGDAVPSVHPQGDVIFCGVIFDITERKQIEQAYQENERRLRMALGVSGMGVWTWNIATNQMQWIADAETALGAMVLETCSTFDLYLKKLYAADRDILRQAVHEALENGREYRVEYRIVLAGGSICWVGERGGPWQDTDGIVIGIAATVVDISDLKTADAALQESEARYRTLLDNLPGAVYRCQVGQGWQIVVQSEAIADITGYPVNHAAHRVAWRLVHPEDRRYVEQEVTVALNRGRSFELEYRLIHADGSTRWVRDTGQPIPDASGVVQLIDGVLIDITRRKQSETRFRELAQREALINRISTQIRDSLELTPILQTTVQAVRTQLDTDRVVVYRFRPDWSGEVVVEAVIPPWQSTVGESGADNCFAENYAEYYESGRVRAIDNIYQAGLNSCHLEFLEALQVNAALIVPILLKKRLWGLLIAHECQGVRHWSGGEIELLISLAGQAGIAIGQADLYRQATDSAAQAQQQAENLEATLIELQQTQAQLVQTEKMSSLGQLVAGVAHEINNPVSFIDGNISHAWEYAQNLLALIRQYQRSYPVPTRELAKLMQNIDLDFLTEDFPKLLESMRIGAERIKDIVASLRTFSRMDEAEIKAVNIHDGLESTLMILQHRLKANGDRPQICLQRMYSELPPVECYAGQLNQVFMNLISNAVDALEEQLKTASQQFQPEITITTRFVSSLRVGITIADNGPGISAPTRHRIFEPFYTTKPIGKGTGIGLSISYQIITERHQGTLECQSHPGQGTAFHITIPLRQSSLDSYLPTPNP